MIFDEEFIEALQDDVVTGVLEICDRCIESAFEYKRQSKFKESYLILIEGFALIQGLMESGMIHIEVTTPELRMEDRYDSDVIF